MFKITGLLVFAFLSSNLLAIQTEEQEKLSVSMIKNAYKGILGEYKLAKSDHIKNPNNPFIYYLVKNNNSSSWESLIIHSYNNNDFFPQDISWVIDEYSQPNNLDSKKSSELFQLMIVNHSKNQKSQQIKNLISDILLPKERSLFASYVNCKSTEEYHNALLQSIEKMHLKAFAKILEVFPEFINEVTSLNSCKRKEQGEIITYGFFANEYEYEDINYTLTSWLMRNNNKYLDKKQSFRSNYIEAAKIIIEKSLESSQKIPNELFSMMLLLNKQDDISDEQITKAALRLKGESI